MSATKILQTSGWEDASLTVMARITGLDGESITQASLACIACQVFDLDAGCCQVAAPAVVVTNSVFDAMQTDDPRWTEDKIGYNFRFTLPATAFPTGGHSYRIEFIFTPVGGDSFPFVVRHFAQDLLSS